jgi:hypothetical protein
MLSLASIVAVLMSGEIVTHRLDSPRQSAPTDVRVVVPDDVADGERLRVVYLLPVEAGRERRYGDGLETALEFDAANKFRVVLVAPSFAALPWYADHPTDAKLAQESYFLEDVVPLVEAKYPVVAERRGRLLCGFSKSGWGAWCLLLRHPDKFERAATWDAPLLMDAPGKYGSGPIFGDAENFAKYQITRLFEQRAGSVSDRSPPRLVLLGRGNFPDDVAIHERLQKLNVPHVYRDDLKTKHVWSRDWLEPALELLTR